MIKKSFFLGRRTTPFVRLSKTGYIRDGTMFEKRRLGRFTQKKTPTLVVCVGVVNEHSVKRSICSGLALKGEGTVISQQRGCRRRREHIDLPHRILSCEENSPGRRDYRFAGG